MKLHSSLRNSVSNLTLFLGLTLASLVTVPADPIKIRVPDPRPPEQLQARGARLLADYGGFQLLEVDESAAAGWIAEGAEPAEAGNFIELHARRLDTRSPETKSLRRAVGGFNGRQLHLVQFIGPVKPEWRAALEATGVRVADYIPHNAYLVQGDASALVRLQAWAAGANYVQWDGAYAAEYKLHPKARVQDGKGNLLRSAADTFAIQLLEDADANPATLALINKLKLGPVQQQFRTLHYLNVVVSLPAGRLDEIAAQPEVISIQPRPPRHKMDERQNQILAGNLTGTAPSGPGYLAWLTSKGFTQAQFAASGFVVDVTDSGVDNGTTAPGHFGLYEAGDPNLTPRVAYNRLEGTPNSGSTLQGCDGHGNLNSHIIAGFNDSNAGFPHQDANGFRYGLGICPFVQVGSSVIFDTDSFTFPVYPDLAARAYRDGARVSNNSWGADTAGEYDVDSQAYDALVRDSQPAGSAVPNSGNQEFAFLFAAGNAGSGAQTVGSPGSAKNVLTVGAAENVHSHSTANGGNSSIGNDGCSTPDSGANSANDIASFSSRGPCADGRQKPDLVAPGTHVTGGVGQTSTATNGTGAALSCFNATGVCALPGGGSVGNANNFFPLGQQFYSTSSGTSHSTPAVAGACALLRQYFINQALNPPSPAMTKAFLVNSARYLNGTSAGDTLPSPNQGMGEVNLGTAFDGVTRIVRDQLGADKFTASGQTRAITGTVTDPAKPFRVTLAWTDAPGSTTGAAYNNNLDLTVTVGGNTYKGNVFSGGGSVAGGAADAKNNLESVFLPAGVAGNFVVTVTAANINSDGVPNEAPSLDQDYALVIYNGEEVLGPVITTGAFAVTAESCNPTNGAVDPGETVTLSFPLQNLGNDHATAVVATLLETGGVTNASGPQSYGTLTAGGGAVTQSFSFTAVGVCGSNLVATLSLQDATTNLGNVSFVITLGRLSPIFTQNFDGVSAPSLPAGWTTSGSGGQTAWVTSTSQPDTLPNAAYSVDSSSAGVNELVSPVLAITSASAQLTFQHAYNTESGWDGGVLEIKIGAGSFTDIVAAGGSFVVGSYSGTLGSGSANPLAGRAAWTGNSGGFVTTTVELPTTVGGQNVQFRWRCATDNNTAGSGWFVDSVVVSARICCGGATYTVPSLSADAATLTAESCVTTNGVIDPGETVTLDFSMKNVGTGDSTNLVATLLASGGVNAPSGPQNYGAVLAGGAAVARPFSFTANGACGSDVVATFHLQDGTADLGSVAYGFTLGAPVQLLSQTFDGVTPPTLPAGWSTTASGGQGTWTTSATSAHTAPNAAYSAEAASAGVNELVSPVIALPGVASKLSFQNAYDLEAGFTTAYDGGVLEIKIAGGAWADIISAGGSFISGGYNFTLSSLYSNPLAGRQAWSGDSGGFLTTVVALPPAAAGQNIQLRWRCGTDSSSGGNGWRVDSILLTARICCSDILPPTITTPPTNRTAQIGDNVTFVVAAGGTGPFGYQWRHMGTNLAGATASSYTRSNVQLSHAGNYSVVVSNVAGTTNTPDAVLTVIDPNATSIIARWNFNSDPADTNTTTGVTTPVIGVGTASVVGGAVATFASGSGGDTNTVDNSGWNSSSYPGQGTGNKTRGVQFSVSTVGKQGIGVTFDERVSGSASKYVRLQYSADGVNFTDYPAAIAMLGVNSFEAKSNSLAAITSVNDNPHFAFRLVSEFESTALNNLNANYVTAVGATYGSAGTMRYDMVTVWGIPMTPGLQRVTFSAAGYDINGQFNCLVGGATGSSWVVQASPDLTNWIALVTNTAPFAFSDTNSAGFPQRFYRAQRLP